MRRAAPPETSQMSDNSPEKPVTRATPQALLVDDQSFEQHRPTGYHPERPERLTAARAAAEHANVSWQRVAVREATDDQLARVHSPAFVESLEKLRGHRGYLDPDTYYCEQTIVAARRAAGGVAAMVEDMLSKTDGSVGVAMPRPPGHHARPSQAMGFCLLNNIAVAAAHARALGVGRVAIVDFDVHHGNGTQEMFYRDPAVLYISTHQYPFYPGTGAADEIGEGEGTGFTVNIPLTAGGGDSVYRGAFDRIVLPVLEQYAPELLLVSAGFDASARDPLAEMNLSERGFGYMTQKLTVQARRSARGRMGLVLEGGYDLVALEAGLADAISAAIGDATFEVPTDPENPDIERAVREARAHWKLA